MAYMSCCIPPTTLKSGKAQQGAGFLQMLVYSALILADRPDVLHWARRWIEGLSDGDMPPEVRKYTVDFLSYFEQAMRKRPRRPAGRQSVESERDELIKHTVDLVAAEFKVKPTRNRATRDVKSGCSIVAKALQKLDGPRMTESSVNDIYRRQTRGLSRHKQI